MEKIPSTVERPEWYKESDVEIFRSIRESLIALEPRNSDALNSALCDFEDAHPDAKRYLAFHILIGSSLYDDDLANLNGIDYPDHLLKKFVRTLLNKFLQE